MLCVIPESRRTRRDIRDPVPPFILLDYSALTEIASCFRMESREIPTRKFLKPSWRKLEMKMTLKDRLATQLWALIGMVGITWFAFIFREWHWDITRLLPIVLSLFLLLAFMVGASGVIPILRGRARNIHLTLSYFFPIWGFWIDGWSIYRREEKRLREEDAVRRIQKAIELLEEGEDIKESLESVAVLLEEFGSAAAINESSGMDQWLDDLIETLLARRERQAQEEFLRDAQTWALSFVEFYGRISSDIVNEVRERQCLPVIPYQERMFFDEEERKKAINKMRDPVLQINLNDTLSPAQKIVALLKLEGVTLDLED